MAGSISEWISHLKSGEADAARKLWGRYAERLAMLARQRLAGRYSAVCDEDDIVQSVFFSFCRGVAAGRFRDLSSRDELWWLLLSVTRQKTISSRRRIIAQKRGFGRVRSETVLAEFQPFRLDDLISKLPTPQVILILEEEYLALMARLEDLRLQQIAALRVEGQTIAEISEKLGICRRSVERKLHLIRTIWSDSVPKEA